MKYLRIIQWRNNDNTIQETHLSTEITITFNNIDWFQFQKSVNALLVKIDCKPCCEYIIAGGDAALLTSQESPEDSPKAGVKALQEVNLTITARRGLL